MARARVGEGWEDGGAHDGKWCGFKYEHNEHLKTHSCGTSQFDILDT